MAHSRRQPLLVEFIKSNPVDAEFRSAEYKFTSGARKVMETSNGLDRLEKSMVCVMDSDKFFVKTFNSCTKQIHDTKDQKEREEIKSLIDHFLITQYLTNSHETAKFLTGELRSFINSAEDVANCIAHAAAQNRMTNELRMAKQVFHRKAKLAVNKVTNLHKKHWELLAQLDEKIKKINSKLKLARALTKVVNVIFIGIFSALFACSIMAVALTINPGVAAAIGHHATAVISGAAVVAEALTPAIKGGERLLIRMMRAYQSTLEARERLLVSLRAGTANAIRGLDDIISHVNKLIRMGNDPRIWTMLREFQSQIKKLNETKNKCVTDTENARKKVLEDYKNLWRVAGKAQK